MICTSCLTYVALAAFVGWRIIKESGDSKVCQPHQEMWEEMKEEMMKK